MSDSSTFDFSKFVPGFDFLKKLSSGGATAIPQASSWIAPTLDPEELEKRIQELKAVHFWLEQNSRALGATIQALEVQKMTLATLKGMNFNIADMANALKLKAADSVFGGVQKATEKASASDDSAAKAAATSPLGDPLQLWGSLTQQFQNIAASALKEATSKTAVDITKNMAAGLAKDALKTATAATKKAVAKRAAPRKAPAKKATGR